MTHEPPGRRFSRLEDAQMLRLRLEARSIRHVAAVLGRSPSSVQVRLDWLRNNPAEAAVALAQENEMARKAAGMNGSGDRLLSLIERIERLQEEMKALREGIKDIKAEAKSAGYDPKVMMQMVRERAMEPRDREEWAALCDIYRAALGMLDGTPLGEAARKRFADEMREDATLPAGAAEDVEEAAAPDTASPEADSVPAAKSQGAEAAGAGAKVTSNPYGFSDPRRAAWDEGWCGATGSDGMDLPAAWRRSKPAKGAADGAGKEGGA